MNYNEIYPWQSASWTRLTQHHKSLAHALLIHGKIGIGKRQFAQALSQYLLCDNPINGLACNSCAKCTWFNEGNHPDFILIAPEDGSSDDESTKKTTKKTQISVSQIRLLIEKLSLTNHSTNARRIVLICPAEALNVASANALLKALEEPPDNTLFLLVTHQLNRLLPTIISRCQRIAMPLPDKEVAGAWLIQQGIKEVDALLAYCGGSPLLALDESEKMANLSAIFKQLSLGVRLDIFSCLSLLMGMSMDDAVSIMQKWLCDLTYQCHQTATQFNYQQSGALQALAKSVNLVKLMDFERALIDAKRTALHPLNQELQLTGLLAQYQKIFKVN
jgi:DNA polymerase III subunit delta'